jgi:hypothetical protein
LGAIGYYGFLAKRFPPQRLVAVAARRALRSAWQKLGPRAAPPRRDQLLAALSCRDSITLARRLAHLRLARSPWEPEELRRTLDRHLPGEVERALARAEAVASGRLRIFGREVDVSRPDGGIDWQLDPVRGGRFAAWAPSEALPDAPGLDIKMPWAIGRGEHWVALACGAALDGRRARELAGALFASVRDFCAANPMGRGVHWTSAMEAALRAVNLLQALWILSACRLPLDPGFALDAARLAISTGRFVLAHLEDDTAVPNNHLASDWLGLLACAHLVPAWPEAGRWQALATAGMARAIHDQVHPEGTSFEGSVPYHRLATEIFTAAAILARSTRAALGGAYARRLLAMYRATRALLSDAGDLPRIGDDDSGRVLSVRERRSGEAAWLLSLGAALFLDPSLLVGPGPGDAAEVAWLLGPGALDRLARARGGPPRRSASFPRGGFHVLRRGRTEVFVSCGPNGQRGLGGHSHNDKLALEVRIGGAVAICDPGSPTYTADPDLRNAFRSTRAHATVVVDGLEQAPIPLDRPFALPEAAAARLLAFDEGVEATRLVGEHRGFAQAEVIHRRDVTVASSGAVVVDRIAGSGTHAVELRWPLAPTGARVRPVAPEERPALAALARFAGVTRPLDLDRAVEVPLAGGVALLLAFACPARLDLDLAPALWSPRYGELRDGAIAVLAGPLACPAALATLLLPLPLAGGRR